MCSPSILILKLQENYTDFIYNSKYLYKTA